MQGTWLLVSIRLQQEEANRLEQLCMGGEWSRRQQPVSFSSHLAPSQLSPFQDNLLGHSQHILRFLLSWKELRKEAARVGSRDVAKWLHLSLHPQDVLPQFGLCFSSSALCLLFSWHRSKGTYGEPGARA